MRIIWITFLCLFLVLFFVSVICLVVLIWSRMSAKPESETYGTGNPYDAYGASPHSLEMQHRWLRHKAMVKNNEQRRNADDSSDSSRRSKKSKRSKSDSTSAKKAKKTQQSSDAPRNDVMIGQQPQQIYIGGNTQQPQMVGVPQGQQPIRVVVRNQQPIKHVVVEVVDRS
jgi:SLT domain-containing protein